MASLSGEDCSCTTLEVGSIVRAPRTTGGKPKGRAMVAMIQDDHSVCLLWETCIPKSLNGKSRFLVAPNLPDKVSLSQDEITLNQNLIRPLLDFEAEDTLVPSDCKDRITTIQLWKERGDQLLRLGDPSSAIPYYEKASEESSTISIGSSVICSVAGYPKVAEVDCVDDDTVDLVYLESGEEATIPRSGILIAILEESTDHLQERILLNLARCLLQHSDVDASHRPNYLKAAVLACTLVLSMSTFYDADGGSSSDNSQTALQLRIKAQMGLSKWPHASADCKRLIHIGNPHGHKLLDQVEREKKLQAKRDKKLVKAFSQLVQTATSQSVSDDTKNRRWDENDSGDSSTSSKLSRDAASAKTGTSARPCLPLLSPHMILLVLLAAFLIQKFLF